MKNKFIRKTLIIVSIICLLFTTACNKNESVSEDGKSVTITSESFDETTAGSDSAITSETAASGQTDSSTETTAIAPVANKEISIYTMNESTLEVEAAVALVPENEEITPQLIVDLVVDSLADRSVTVGIDKISTKDDAVIVSFLSDQPPLVNVGSGVEATILDAIAQSLVDNLEQYTKVIFQVEGGPYASGHFEFGIDEVYLDANSSK